MEENPNKQKRKILINKIYSPKREKLLDVPKISFRKKLNAFKDKLCASDRPTTDAVRDTEIKNFKNTAACVFSICGKCKLKPNLRSHLRKICQVVFSRLNLEKKAGAIKRLKEGISLPRLNLGKKKVYLKKALALATILAVIITAYFQNTPQASAATFTLYQTQWLSVNASEVHNPTGGQTTITTYSAKDTNLNLANGGGFTVVRHGGNSDADNSIAECEIPKIMVK